MIPAQLTYDITSCKFKYEEGFVSIFGHIFTKPEFMWKEETRRLIIPTDYSLCIGLSLQTGTLLLLQCFWNYLANAVAQANFMSSKEFRFYIGWTIAGIFIFPCLRYNFARDVYEHTYKEVMPQLVYGCGLLIVACLGIRSHFRFNKLIMTSKAATNQRSIAHKIRNFQDLNMILTAALFVASISMIILCADGLTPKKTLNVHKFSADFLICNVNVTSMVVWIVVVLIIHPVNNNNQNTSPQAVAPLNSNRRFNNKKKPNEFDDIDPESTIGFEEDKSLHAAHTKHYTSISMSGYTPSVSMAPSATTTLVGGHANTSHGRKESPGCETSSVS
ncbi:uncharacterized protein BYT42DRAFT_406369 [Radiomyces spectabilis]|uniref:uncharacterized protein n=1 Tax=Radiomyces spectabilis TaxID=64574 RepID=UPI00221F9778|nr:uncharacterized protein BYT42DRAFT_406369 [Radiomyces spectabilis]KAI8374485.1 hypothetical protein BYT42DRAFT_406369 [Radiomyces spectabilis]